ncbi:hypothetical protein M501DRAFT_1058912 [Patellaria atrata CBS 101060]|uniref:Telomere-associated protein Rif1 N-terminal domain-containing protein n=1 Tax=Patellaria atrata CBS 101060 TaxID=1346257 RepID=A0A9P4VQ46_9PEZI|nr:hypothetical protein M501DRAFT_1058912 [Patellaria atrata CBS 101060]
MAFPSALHTIRPPTPPRDLNRDISDALHFLDDSFEVDRTLGNIQPPSSSPIAQSPSSSAELLATGSSKPRKRVDFSPWTKYHKATEIRDPAISSPLRPLPSPHDRKPLKSILKSNDSMANVGSQNPDPYSPNRSSPPSQDSFPEMLEFMAQQLAVDNKQIRLDAYNSLFETLQAHGKFVDFPTLGAKMGLLSQFLERDLRISKKSADTSDLNIITKALKLILLLLQIPDAANTMGDAFCTFLVNESVSILEDASTPKALASHYLHLLAHQKFSGKVMTVERVSRILDTLQSIQDRVKGNGAIAARLVIYQRLLTQSRQIMTNKFSVWIEHVFHGMLSSIIEIRNRAIELGLCASLALGSNSQVSKVVVDLLNRKAEEGISYGQFIATRVNKMLDKKRDNLCVPQIWSVFMLFLRAKRQSFERWPNIRLWISIMQRCFNSSTLRKASNVAWNRFVFALNPDTSTPMSVIRMLRQPLAAQLHYKGGDKTTKELSLFSYSSYCNLLHYAFRPNEPSTQLTLYWAEFVSPIIKDMAPISTKHANAATRVLISLFGGSTPKVWNENIANEVSNITPDDIPRLDTKWIRQNLSLVLQVVEPCLKNCSWSSKPQEIPLARKLWSTLMVALADAGSKEVKASMELKEAIASLTNFIHTFWSFLESNHLESGSLPRIDVDDFAFLIKTAMESLGPIHFTEKTLVRKGNESEFEVAPTPSHRGRTSGKLFQAPILHILELMLPPSLTATTKIAVLRSLLLHSVASKNSRSAKMAFLRDCADVTRIESSREESVSFNFDVWHIVADLAEVNLRSNNDEMNSTSQRLGEEYANVLAIIRVGFYFPQYLTSGSMGELFIALAETVTQETGSAGMVIAITEPLAAVLMAESKLLDPKLVLSHTTLLLEKTQHPSKRKLMEEGRKLLSGITVLSKTTDFDPYNELYLLIADVSVSCYKGLYRYDHELVLQYLISMIRFISTSPTTIAGTILHQVQGGISTWIMDAEQKLTGELKELKYKAVLLWETAVNILKDIAITDSRQLNTFDELIASGLLSSHAKIANKAIETWNFTFRKEQLLEYPPRVEAALRKLRSHVDLETPGLSGDGEDAKSPGPPQYLDSQDSFLEEYSDTSKNMLKPPLQHLPKTRSPASDHPIRQRLSTESPSTPTRKPKPSHQDSQIEFAAVNSSPNHDLNAESQNLTEDRKEIMEKQQNSTVAMFLDIRSTPHLSSPFLSTPTTFLRRSLDKELENGSTTITLPIPVHRPMDACVNSSPTPSSCSRRGPILSDEVDIATPTTTRSIPFETLAVDVPSSPPSMCDTDLPVGFEGDHHIEEMDQMNVKIQNNGLEATSTEKETYQRSSEADSLLNAQIDCEIEARANRSLLDISTADSNTPGTPLESLPTTPYLPSDTFVDANPQQQTTTDIDPEPEVFIEASQPLRVGEELDQGISVNQSHQSDITSGSTSRVESSFIAEQQAGNSISPVKQSAQVGVFQSQSPSQSESQLELQTQTQSSHDSIASTDELQKTKKRKSPITAGDTHSAKRQKRKSPIKRAFNSFISHITGTPPAPEDQDDEIYDCIAVTTSPIQPQNVSQTDNIKSEPVNKKLRSSRVSQTPSEDTSVVAECKPRKKRKGMAPDESSDPLAARNEGEGEATQESSTRRGRKKQKQSQEKDISTALGSSAVSASSRKLSHVLIDISDMVSSNTSTPVVETEDETGADAVGRGTSVAEGGRAPTGVETVDEDKAGSSSQGSVANERRKLTPKSLIERLKGILSDIPSLVFGSPQELREVDDVVLDIMRSAHTAAHEAKLKAEGRLSET